jgi:hypothetical protein
MHDRRLPPLSRSFWLIGVLTAAGCATFDDQDQPLVPTRHQTRTGPYVVFSNFPIAPDAPTIRCLHSLETDIEANLGIRVVSEEPAVEVYILNDRAAFDHFLKFYYPELPPRRAFFLAQGTRRVVYTFLGERLEEDLRHEATHALLHVAVGNLPLWLDEGLAEYFEGPDNRHGLNPEHLSRLPQDIALGWAPDLGKLESLTNVRELTTRDYRESWAWVHYLLNGSNTGKLVLLDYLVELHSSPKTAKPISERLPSGAKSAGALLLAHLQRVRAQPVAASMTVPATAVRLQSHSIEPSSGACPSRRGNFGWLRALFRL